MEEKTKITTKTYYACGTCSKKMESIKIGGGNSGIFDFYTSSTAMYCGNKECEKFGFLTVVGIKKEE